MKKISLILSTILLTLVLVSCQNIKNDNNNYETVQIAQTVSISNGKDDKGNDIYGKKLVVEDFRINPKRVVTFSYGVLDMLDFVGLENAKIEALALPKSNIPKSLEKYNDEKYINAGTLFDPLYEALTIFNPDLIILDGRTANLYEKFKKEFPGVDILDATNTTYSLKNHYDIVNNLAKIFKSVEKQLLNEMENIAFEILKIKQVTKNHKALFLMSNGPDISVSGVGGRYQTLHLDFGFQEADPNGQVGAEHGNLTRLEYLGLINPEIIFVMDRAKAIGDDSGFNNLKNEPQFKELDAFKNNKIYELSAEAWYIVTGGFTSTRQMINDILKFVNDNN